MLSGGFAPSDIGISHKLDVIMKKQDYLQLLKIHLKLTAR